MTILVAEDDFHTRNGLMEILEDEGYRIIPAQDGKEALELYHKENPNMLCLDIMMPEMNGYDVCKKVRETNKDIPIIFLSAKSEEIDKVIGLELGADDFITKPFGVKEVIARIRAVTRRYLLVKKTEENHFFMKLVKIVPGELRAYKENGSVELSVRDLSILKLLYENKGKVIDRNTLFNHCWGLDYLPNSRTLDQHISQLRKKIEEDPKNPSIIRTVHNAGYRYEG